jgi:outer membrane receptor for ferrienterochelin and colicins
MKNTIIFLLLICTSWLCAQSQGNIKGNVRSQGAAVPSVNVGITSLKKNTMSDENGQYNFEQIAFGTYELQVSAIGFQTVKKTITITSSSTQVLNFDLTNFQNNLSEVVITGTKTFKRQTDSPIMVAVLDSKSLNNLQVCNLSEGLKFQPGLRVETDCQTCNYTQLRMNGLAGGYSQILINGRPLFSPLMGLYGMEQLPVNMIERIEVVRGGGSSLYGSSAIGGTVNVITKIPKKDAFELNTTYYNINGQSNDYNLNGNTTLVNDDRTAGVSLFLSHRERDHYDANGDNFSEIPLIENNSIGTNFFVLPADNQKLELSISNLNEYRFGGEITDQPAYLTQQSEERKHKIWMGSVDYQINFNNDNSSLITYGAWQNTDRKHYTGIFPNEPAAIQNHLLNPPYGISTTQTLQGGFQFNHKLNNFLNGTNVFTIGTEYVSDRVFDEIQSYNYLIDQHTKDFGSFVQSDWEITPNLDLLSGIRFDKHNLVDQVVASPRIALLYKYKTNTQFRLSYGTGFRAPQAFDTDLHIAFAGGGISRVVYDPNLKEERSKSFSGSINYDKAAENWVAGFTLEAFYTKLKDAFVLENVGQDTFGQVFQKQNGSDAIVQGITLELRANLNRKLQLESGYTIQTSKYAQAVTYIAGVAPTTEFLRTPNQYGFAMATYTPSKQWNMNLNYVYTGNMKIAHFAGATNQTVDEMVLTKPFSEVNSKIGYTIERKNLGFDFEIYGGMKNIFNAYQTDFDLGKNRDSNFVYGPSLPRTIFIGLKFWN